MRLPRFTAEQSLPHRALRHGPTLRVVDSPTQAGIVPQTMVCIRDCSLLSCEIDNGGIECTCGMYCEIVGSGGGPVSI